MKSPFLLSFLQTNKVFVAMTIILTAMNESFLTVVDAWSLPTRVSSFSGTALQTSVSASFHKNNNDLVMYDHRGDPPSNKNNHKNNNNNQPPLNAWNVLATTEAWISDTLQSATNAATGENPYSRKEVSYVCETADAQPMIVACMFRRLKEARLQGQRHGEFEQERAAEQGEFGFLRSIDRLIDWCFCFDARQNNFIISPLCYFSVLSLSIL